MLESILVLLVYFVLEIDNLNMIFGFCVFLCIYEVEKMCLFEKVSQKCEQFSYEIFGGIFLGFLVLNGPLTLILRVYLAELRWRRGKTSLFGRPSWLP